MRNIFSCAYLPLSILSGETSDPVFCPFSKWITVSFFFFILNLESNLQILVTSPLSDMYFLPLCGLSFHSLKRFSQSKAKRSILVKFNFSNMLLRILFSLFTIQCTLISYALSIEHVLSINLLNFVLQCLILNTL